MRSTPRVSGWVFVLMLGRFVSAAWAFGGAARRFQKSDSVRSVHAQAGPGADVDGGAAKFLLFMGGVSSCRRYRRGVVGARAARLLVVFYRVYTRERTLTHCQKPVIKPVSQAAGWLLLGHAACALSQRSGRVNAAAP